MKFSLPNWRAYVAEFLGTFVFVFVAAGAVLTNVLFGELGSLGVPIATGLSLGVMIFATVAISGGNLNPAVTFSLWLAQKISTVTAVFYVLMQLLASVAAAYSLQFIFGSRATEFFLGGPALSVDTTVPIALSLEAILTAVLVFVVFATAVDKRGPVSFAPLAIGLTVLVAGIFAGPITGAALNPARAIGPLVVSGHYDSLMVFVIGPLMGSLMGLFYEFVFLRQGKRR